MPLEEKTIGPLGQHRSALGFGDVMNDPLDLLPIAQEHLEAKPYLVKSIHRLPVTMISFEEELFE